MNTPHDPDFDRLLEGSEDLLARYRALPAVEPPRELDVAILAKAREAVARPKPNRLRWLVPVASVATVALAAGIGWKVFHAEQQATSRQAAGESAREEQIVEFELLDLPNRDAERKELANSPPLPQEPAKPAAPAPALSAPPAPAPAAAALPEPFVADAVPAETAEQRAQEAPGKRASEKPFMEPHLRADHAGLSQPPEADRRKAEVSASRAGNLGVTGADADADGNELPGAAAKSNAAEILEPEEWIGKIRDLQVRRRFTEVRKELAAFRQTYPNYPLPDDLAKLAR